MKAYRRGLVVGKFAPLHPGHEWLIAQAQSECDSVLVLSYSRPEPAGCPPVLRRRWLRTRLPDCDTLVLDDEDVGARCRARGLNVRAMPTNDAPDADHQRYLAWLLTGPLGEQPDALFGAEPYIQSCAGVLAETWGAPVAARQFDRARSPFRISGSALRNDAALRSLWLAPPVRSDWIGRIVLLGGESSGKSTLAPALAEALDEPWVAEYGREHWERQQGKLDLADLLFIGREQRRREERAAEAARQWLVCDTHALTTLGYAQWMFGASPPEIEALASVPPALAVLCEPDFPFVQDGTRRDDGFRLTQHRWYEAQLERRGWMFLRVRGAPSARVEQVVRQIGAGCTRPGP